MSDPETTESLGAANNAKDVAKLTRWQRFKAHMKKWWWVYLIAFGCIVLVVVLPLVYVGIPHFADDYINKYQYDYTGLAITNPRPNAFRVSQSQQLSMGGGFSGSGHLSPFNATISSSDGREFAVFPVPKIEFSGGAHLTIDQDLDISCIDCLSDIAVSAATNKSYSVVVTGHPDLKFGALPTAHLNIDKTMKMNGYNVTQFVNSNGAFNVTSINILKPPVDGYNFNATLSVRNPTPFIVEMGHVKFNLSMGDSPLGYVDLPNLMLEKNVTTTVVLGNVSISTLVDAAFGSDDFGVVTIDVRGHSCDYNGQDIPYYSAAIRAVSASAKVDLLKYASGLFG
ncbi:hypothetical protein PISL3812_00100 [Talaromyces islandicus]|uniref:Uncharacterized protein n=1 Tax=Talaromyces islandicus TaxID=28573 RepID=A0A0U1LIB6_TALIS|nr:hypothetical protein PISL3812_00100 [Talaromyces islandicus]